MWGGDDPNCTARDIGGNLGGPCGCAECVADRTRAPLIVKVDEALKAARAAEATRNYGGPVAIVNPPDMGIRAAFKHTVAELVESGLMDKPPPTELEQAITDIERATGGTDTESAFFDRTIASAVNVGLRKVDPLTIDYYNDPNAREARDRAPVSVPNPAYEEFISRPLLITAPPDSPELRRRLLEINRERGSLVEPLIGFDPAIPFGTVVVSEPPPRSEFVGYVMGPDEFKAHADREAAENKLRLEQSASALRRRACDYVEAEPDTLRPRAGTPGDLAMRRAALAYILALARETGADWADELGELAEEIV